MLRRVRRQLTFVIIGGGPTGVEMAGAVAETARHTLRGEFRRIDPAQARIFLIEGSDRVLNAFPPKLSARAQTHLEQLGVIVRLINLVSVFRPDGVTFRCGEQNEEIAAATLVWAAGVRASPLGKVLADAACIQPDRQGRGARRTRSLAARASRGVRDWRPGPCQTAGRRDAYATECGSGPGVAGACSRGDAGGALRCEAHPPPSLRRHAAAVSLSRPRLDGHDRPCQEPWRWLAPLRFSGLFAWLMWLFIHLMYIVEFR